MMAERASPNAPWLPGFGIVELNAIGSISNPYLTPDELQIFFTSKNLPDSKGDFDIYMAQRPDRNSPFTNIVNLEVNSSLADFHPSISHDGLTLYFVSNRNSAEQIFKATRDTGESSFKNIEQLSFLDLPGYALSYPYLTDDGTTFYFSRRPEGGMSDIFKVLLQK